MNLSNQGPSDDNSRSAYQPGRRRGRDGKLHPLPNPQNARSPGARRRRLDAQRARVGADAVRRQRGQWRRQQRQRRHCTNCGAALASDKALFCLPCAMRNNSLERSRDRIREALRNQFQGGRNPEHERRVRRLQAVQKELPL